ncbi:alpha-(1-_3)-arabinofuranosyltransferase domain-containing protein [Streptomyces uncialis]|uniref:alpha-(1->3)-arabinofuranosyltransferase domain-containing protein n=1 Tax=Streptomyces uncialis TaxID=1048205 RepID=UPI00224EB607|nr:alpha-(1->3)-arabinofuranosyltransferase family protein [Streptomyces uncialis]MCX4663657.1 alpha-(1->3)-arabinofuranosyltransferase [Streptomyces uncialis]
MTSTAPAAQAPPPAAPRTTSTTEGPPGVPRSRRWLAGFWAVVFTLFLVVSPGRMTFDTKLGVTVDPWQFLGDLGQLWQDRAGFGTLTDQYIGYAFPMLPYYGLADLAQLPVWLAERLWLSIVVTAAFWGALRLMERLAVGNRSTRLLGAAVYALWPTYTIVVGSTSAAALPGALLPWVLLPLVDDRYSARVAALRSALLVVCMGGVNAASTLASLLPVALYLLTRPRGPRRRALILWWVPGVLLATLWWVVPLLLLGVYGENFLPYVETSRVTTDTMAATEALRGAGNWVAYLNFGEPWLPAGWSVASSVLVIVASAVAAALGLAGLARRDVPERRWLTLTVLTVALLTLAGYGGTFGGPFHGFVQDLLDGVLVPFRNIYKFQTGLALALVLGLTHLLAVVVREHGARPVRGRRWAPAVAAVLVVPGLALPYVNGSILQPGSFQKLPEYWETTAGWLEKNTPDSRALVVPATAHGVYTWGSPIDQPLDVLAKSRWAQRDYVPFGTAGNRRAMDAVEQALLTGAEVPGLRDFLSRAGLHHVVVRNDLDPDQIGYVPTTTVKRTLEQSGYKRVEGFGPVMTGGRIADDTPLQVEGLFAQQRAVEIYEPAAGTKRPGQAGIYAAADTAVVSGGPETLLPLSDDPSLRDRPTVLTGDGHPGVDKPALQVVGDGLRRADTRFGLVNTNTSYTYTEDERNHSGSVQDPGDEPHQILPRSGVRHQTVAELRGARSVTASSSGNWLFHLPQYDPVNAFDGNPDTAWAVGTSGDAAGEWLRIAFEGTTEMPSSLTVTPLPQNGTRAAPTKVRVETERGSETSPLRANGKPQDIKSPPGGTDWLRITIVETESGGPGLTGAGFSEIEILDVSVTRMLKLPTDAEDATRAGAETVSLHRTADPGGLSPAGTESGLHRSFTTSDGGAHEVRMSAVPVPGEALDKLLYGAGTERPRNQVVATAASTARLGAQLSARNLTDGDLTTAWIAGDEPVVRLAWRDKRPVDRLVLTGAGGLSARPTKVEISSPDGAAIANVDDNGWVRFDPITTDELEIRVTATSEVTLHNPVAGDDLRLPVGLTEITVPALEPDGYRTERPSDGRSFTLECGEGPAVAIDGVLHATSAKGVVQDLVERRPVDVTLCQRDEPDAELTLGTGTHTLEAGDEGPLAVTAATLTRGEAAAPATATRELKVDDWLGDRRQLTVGSGAESYLTTYENVNEGWKATLDGKELTSVRLDGWQQGFRVPEGEGGKVTLSYEPARTYEIGLVVGFAALLGLVGLVLWRRREENPHGPSAAVNGPGTLLGTVALTLVAVVIAGWFALLVPVLAVLALRRHTLLVPIAFVSMTAAGVVAATGAGEAPAAGEGSFGPLAQVLALIALFAALVTVGGGGGGHRRRTAGPAAAGPTGTAVLPAQPYGAPAAQPASAGTPTAGPSGPSGPSGPAGPAGPAGQGSASAVPAGSDAAPAAPAAPAGTSGPGRADGPDGPDEAKRTAGQGGRDGRTVTARGPGSGARDAGGGAR